MRCIINTGFIKIHSAVSLIVSITWKHKQVIFSLITALDYLIKYFFFPRCGLLLIYIYILMYNKPKAYLVYMVHLQQHLPQQTEEQWR